MKLTATRKPRRSFTRWLYFGTVGRGVFTVTFVVGMLYVLFGTDAAGLAWI